MLAILAGCCAAAGQSTQPAPDQIPANQPFRLGEFQREIHGLNDPAGVAIDDAGTIYVAQAIRAQVAVLKADGAAVAAWGAYGETPGQFISPRGIAANGGEVFVSDAGAHRLQVFDANGVFQRSWGARGRAPGEFNQPAGVTVGNDRVYVADAGNSRVQAFDRAGTFLFSLDSWGDGAALTAPADVAVDDAGFIYIADAGLHRVVKFDATGKFVTAWSEWGPFPGFLDEPTGIACRDGLIFVTDRRNHRVQVFDDGGRFIEEWGQHELVPHEGQGRLHYPTGLAIAPNGQFAVISESIENRLQVFGALAPAASLPPRVPYNKAGQTHFGAHIDIDGNLLVVAEPENHFIFVFDVAGEIPIIVNQFGERGDKFGLLLGTAGLDLDFAARRVLVGDAGTLRLQEFLLNYDPRAPQRVDPEMTKFATAWELENLRQGMPEPKLVWPIEPGAIRCDKRGNIFVVDVRNECVIIFDRSMKFLRRFGAHGAGDGQFRQPTDLAFGPTGEEVFVIDSLNRRVQVLSAEGEYRRQWSTQSENNRESSPFGIAVSADGAVYVTDAGTHQVLRYDTNGVLQKRWGQRGAGMGELWKPRGVAIDGQNRVFVIDQGNHRAQIFGADGQWLVTFGAGRAYTPKNMPSVE